MKNPLIITPCGNFFKVLANSVSFKIVKFIELLILYLSNNNKF